MSRRGMTLIELIVGITVAAAALSIGYGAFSSIVDNRSRAEAATREVAEASAIRQALISWLSGARLTASPGDTQFRGLDGVHRDLPADELSFLTTARTPIGVAQSIVRLYVDRNDETPEGGLVASISEWRGTERRVIEIHPLVTGFETRYLSNILGERRWLPSWISSTVLPAGIEITLSSEPPDTLPSLLRFPIVVAFRSGA